jgi:hypothetical protein
MTLDRFRASLNESNPRDNLPPLLTALWWDANGDWNECPIKAEHARARAVPDTPVS